MVEISTEVWRLLQQTSHFSQVTLPVIVTIWDTAEYLIVKGMISGAKKEVGKLIVHIILEELVSAHFGYNLNQHWIAQTTGDGKYHSKCRLGTEHMTVSFPGLRSLVHLPARWRCLWAPTGRSALLRRCSLPRKRHLLTAPASTFLPMSPDLHFQPCHGATSACHR